MSSSPVVVVGESKSGQCWFASCLSIGTGSGLKMGDRLHRRIVTIVDGR
jgi:hypothetical protein